MSVRKKLLKYQELASRLNGVQIPIFGLQWAPTEPELKIVRDVITFLEDRRVLYNPSAWEMEDEVMLSVLRIREVLTDTLQRLPGDSKASAPMRAMRLACREYLNSSRDHHGRYNFVSDLGRLRTLFGVEIAFLAIQYGIDLEDDLASIVPPQLAGLLDDEDEPPHRLPPRR